MTYKLLALLGEPRLSEDNFINAPWIDPDRFIPDEIADAIVEFDLLTINPFDPRQEIDRFKIIGAGIGPYLRLPEIEATRHHRDQTRPSYTELTFQTAPGYTLSRRLERTLSKDKIVAFGGQGRLGKVRSTHDLTQALRKDYTEIYKRGQASVTEVLFQIEMTRRISGVPEIIAAGELTRPVPGAPDLQMAEQIVLMQKIEGIDIIDFQARLHREMQANRISEDDAHALFAMILFDIGTALFHMKQNDLVHHDVNPNNIRIGKIEKTGRFQAFLLDFGLAQWLAADTYNMGTGTPDWMSLESLNATCRQIINENPDFWNTYHHALVQDVYSLPEPRPSDKIDSYGLGVTLAFLLNFQLPQTVVHQFNDRPPYERRCFKMAQAYWNIKGFQFVPNHATATDASTRLHLLIQQMVSPNPADRPSGSEIMKHPFVTHFKSQFDSPEKRELLFAKFSHIISAK